MIFFIAIHRGTGVEFAAKSIDRGSYNEFVYGGYTLPEELVLHYKATREKQYPGFFFYYLKP